MEERQWRIPALHAALQTDGFELSRATLYRIVEGKSALPADLTLWAMCKLGQSVDEQLGIRQPLEQSESAINSRMAGQLEDAIYGAGMRLVSRLLAGDLAAALTQSAQANSRPQSQTNPAAVSGLLTDENAYAVSEARQRLRARSQQILEQMSGASVEESSAAPPAKRVTQGRGGR